MNSQETHESTNEPDDGPLVDWGAVAHQEHVMTDALASALKSCAGIVAVVIVRLALESWALSSKSVGGPSGLMTGVLEYTDWLKGLGALSLITTGVFCLVWLYRTLRTASTLESLSLELSPGLAVLSACLPFVNLVIPYRTVRNLYILSDPLDLPNPRREGRVMAANEDSDVDYRESPKKRRRSRKSYTDLSAPFALWWGAWVVSWIIPNAKQSPKVLSSPTYSGMISSLIEFRDLVAIEQWNLRVELSVQICVLVSLLAGLRVLKAIDHRRQERFRRHRARG